MGQVDQRIRRRRAHLEFPCPPAAQRLARLDLANAGHLVIAGDGHLACRHLAQEISRVVAHREEHRRDPLRQIVQGRRIVAQLQLPNQRSQGALPLMDSLPPRRQPRLNLR